ncbi:subtilisin-like serine protease 2 [Zostera marina]|uniref:Subtilisin-like serine protease 2 n=1 Tax=Zostera marina TaxID=29655 RepID=A0A0K9NUK6_ZOSMR|nr:subtilisin-like serine protease 2 [Zostera marina]
MKSVFASILFLASILPSILSSTFDIQEHHHQTPTTYIVHVSSSEKPPIFHTHHNWYSSTLKSLPHSHLHRPNILYIYSRAASGFSARLTPIQADALSQVPAVLSVLPERIHHVHTTHTPTFLGLSDDTGIWPNSDYAEDVVVGVLDTGIWPESKSFSDEGFSPVPSFWKGECETGKDFNASSCNRKLIGATFFCKGYEAAIGRAINETEESRSPRDTEGHGSHTASTAAGVQVDDAEMFGYAAGRARGMAIRARLAAYKICWALGCMDSDILAAMDKAVSDGVHVISLSVGTSGYAPKYYHDSIAIGGFGAMKNGVLLSASAGNSGSGPYTAVNIAPWILTVGASTVDREFLADAVLGDGSVYTGASLYSGKTFNSTFLPLVYAGDCGSELCIIGELDSSKVSGKIVLCDRGISARVEKGSAVKLAGGAGMILANDKTSGEELVADSHLVPATMVGSIEGDKIRNYIKSDPNPTATINFQGTVIGPIPSAPKVAAFSSRGPNYQTPEIIKPDIIAPGVNILAAWTGASSPTDLSVDTRRVEYNIISGTSMSCPHASGLAALLRKAYPNWTPSAVKSALMTTAYNSDNSNNTIGDLATGDSSNPFGFGSGHVNPNQALNPGLIYDIKPDDYIAFLCSIGYSEKEITVVVNDPSKVDCSSKTLSSPGDLNYPSFAVVFNSVGESVTYSRIVENVGKSDAVYHVEISAPNGIEIVVNPSKLVFSKTSPTLSYTVSFSLKTEAAFTDSHAFGSISWKDCRPKHVVRSPVAFTLQSDSVASI